MLAQAAKVTARAAADGCTGGPSQSGGDVAYSMVAARAAPVNGVPTSRNCDSGSSDVDGASEGSDGGDVRGDGGSCGCGRGSPHVSHMPSEASGDAMDVAALRGRERWGVLVVRTVAGKAGAGGSRASGLPMRSVTASRVRLTTPGAYVRACAMSCRAVPSSCCRHASGIVGRFTAALARVFAAKINKDLG